MLERCCGRSLSLFCILNAHVRSLVTSHGWLEAEPEQLECIHHLVWQACRKSKQYCVCACVCVCVQPQSRCLCMAKLEHRRILLFVLKLIF